MASTVEVELKIYKSILGSIFPNKQTVSIWSDNKQKRELFKAIARVKIVSNQEDADIFILYKTKCRLTSKPIFVGTYALLKQCKRAIGGFYWQKGRPNLLFLRKNLKTHDILLSKELEEYLEDEI
jgi:hypothetical protein